METGGTVTPMSGWEKQRKQTVSISAMPSSGHTAFQPAGLAAEQGSLLWPRTTQPPITNGQPPISEMATFRPMIELNMYTLDPPETKST